MTLLFNAPQNFQLPLAKGADLYFAFRYMPLVTDEDGQPVLDAQGRKQFAEADYPQGASVQLVIETDDPDEPIVVEAEIDGSLATVWEDRSVADTVAKGKLWRAVVAHANGLDQVMCNGTTIRSDGKG